MFVIPIAALLHLVSAPLFMIFADKSSYILTSSFADSMYSRLGLCPSIPLNIHKTAIYSGIPVGGKRTFPNCGKSSLSSIAELRLSGSLPENIMHMPTVAIFVTAARIADPERPRIVRTETIEPVPSNGGTRHPASPQIWATFKP